MSATLALCCVTSLLNSCSMIGSSAKEVKAEQKQQGADADAANTPEGFGGLRNVQPRVSAPAQLYDESVIEWANEDPNAPMPGLEALWEAGPKDEWFLSYEEAMKEAAKKGLPVLAWFTDSKSSMTTQALSNELFSTTRFERWANTHVVRLRIDANVTDDNEDRLARKREYINKLKKRFKVMGSPVVVMLSPRGSVFGKYAGYKRGNADYYFGRLRNAQRNAVVDYGQWREELERKGYRMWHDHRGRKVFAKPRGLRNGKLYLVEPDGSRSVTTLNKLSPEDRRWVTQQQDKKKKSR